VRFARDRGRAIAAGVRDTSRIDDDGKVTLAIAGRVLDRNAKAVRFTSPSGDSIERRIGGDGFFVAGVEVAFCPEEDGRRRSLRSTAKPRSRGPTSCS
jgi:hypothetical protein